MFQTRALGVGLLAAALVLPLAGPVAGAVLPGVRPAVADPHVEDETVPDQSPDPAPPSTDDARDATDDVLPGTADQVTFAIAPAGPDGADGRISFRTELEPGETHEDHVEVTNYSERTVDFTLLSSDGVVTEGGTFDLLPSGVEPVDTGAWIDVAPELELGPMESAVVPFTLTVPEDALPGDHPGGIVASLSSVGSDEDGNAVSLDTRAGARIHLRVAGEIVPSLAVDGLEVDYRPSWNPFAPGSVELSWDVANDGNVRLGAEQAAEVSGLLGFAGGTVALEELREVLPGQAARQTVTVEAWPTFRLDAGVSVAPLVVGADDVAELPVESVAAASAWAVPWLHLALLAGLVAMAVVLVRRRRSRRAAFAAAIEAAREEGARREAEPDAAGTDAGRGAATVGQR